MSELLQRIANYFVYQYKGNDKVAPKMDMSVDDLRNIVVLHVEKCKLEAELRNLQYVKTNADRIRIGNPKFAAVYDAIINSINRQPTAYDVDKVVEQLKTDSSIKLYGSGNSNNYLIPVERAINIVKAGGMNNNSKTSD